MKFYYYIDHALIVIIYIPLYTTIQKGVDRRRERERERGWGKEVEGESERVKSEHENTRKREGQRQTDRRIDKNRRESTKGASRLEFPFAVCRISIPFATRKAWISTRNRMLELRPCCSPKLQLKALIHLHSLLTTHTNFHFLFAWHTNLHLPLTLPTQHRLAVAFH